MKSLPFDVVFADTCVGGSTVASELARSRRGVRAFFMADYAVNPLGVKSEAAVEAALDRWVDAAATRAGKLVVACNTASVRLRGLPRVVARAEAMGLTVHSMVDFLEQMLAREGQRVAGKKVCVMGTSYTVGNPLYAQRILEAGAAGVLPLAATRTEGVVAHLLQDTPQGREVVLAEVKDCLAGADAVVLACTCFPMVGGLIREVNPDIALLDPAAGVQRLGAVGSGEGPNRMTVGLTGHTLAPSQVEARFSSLFPGWMLEGVETISLP